jgi:hypothetical protein
MPELFSLFIFLIFTITLMPSFNQTPEQAARDNIDAAFIRTGRIRKITGNEEKPWVAQTQKNAAQVH